MKKKVFYIIFADILVASLLFVVCNINELGFVIITFCAMCVSGVFGFFLRRSEETEKIGDIMLYNTFIIPLGVRTADNELYQVVCVRDLKDLSGFLSLEAYAKLKAYCDGTFVWTEGGEDEVTAPEPYPKYM